MTDFSATFSIKCVKQVRECSTVSIFEGLRQPAFFGGIAAGVVLPFWTSTLMSCVLMQVMVEAGQKVAMITDSSGQPIGALTKEQIMQRMGKDSASSPPLPEDR